MLQGFSKLFRSKPTDIVGLDLGATGIKAVRARKSSDSVVITAVDLLPALQTDGEHARTPTLSLPRNLKARLVALTVSGENSVIKVLTVPGRFDSSSENKIAEHMGIEKTSEYRIAYKIISDLRNESKVLAVALPEAQARQACQLFPTGTPAPHSLAISGLAAVTAFSKGPLAAHPEEAVSIIEFGAHVTTVAFFHNSALTLVRKLDFGSDRVVSRLRDSLGIDMETTQQVLFEGSFDVSQQLAEIMGPFVKQMVVSRDFVERRENCRISKLYMSGGLVASKSWSEQVQVSLGTKLVAWNPFDSVTLAPGAFPEHLQGQESRFAAAIGAALGGFDES